MSYPSFLLYTGICRKDVSSTGDMIAKDHNYLKPGTNNAANGSWSSATVHCGTNKSSDVFTYKCTDCANTKPVTYYATFSKTQNQGCEQDELGSLKFIASLTNPRVGNKVSISSNNNLDKTVCLDHKRRGHEKALNAYSIIEATCLEQSTEKWRCVRYGSNNCNKTYADTHNKTALGHNYTSQRATATYLRSNATCAVQAQYWYSCSNGTCTESAAGKSIGSGYKNQSFPSGKLLAHTRATKEVTSIEITGAGTKRSTAAAAIKDLDAHYDTNATFYASVGIPKPSSISYWYEDGTTKAGWVRYSSDYDNGYGSNFKITGSYLAKYKYCYTTDSDLNNGPTTQYHKTYFRIYVEQAYCSNCSAALNY